MTKRVVDPVVSLPAAIVRPCNVFISARSAAVVPWPWCVVFLSGVRLLSACMLPPLPRLLVLRELRLLTKFRTVTGISTFLRVKVPRNLKLNLGVERFSIVRIQKSY